MGAGK